jgi:hypothetical protein
MKISYRYQIEIKKACTPRRLRKILSRLIYAAGTYLTDFFPPRFLAFFAPENGFLAQNRAKNQ